MIDAATKRDLVLLGSYLETAAASLRQAGRAAIKFGPAVSQREMKKALHESGQVLGDAKSTKMKARVELVGEFEDLKMIVTIPRELASQ